MSFVFSARPQHVYFYLEKGKTRGAAPGAPRSPFDLLLHKLVSGAKILGFQAVPRERGVVLWFESDGKRLGLLVWMIPVKPAISILEAGDRMDLVPGRSFRRIAGHLGNTEKEQGEFTVPDGVRSPADVPFRGEWFRSPSAFGEAVEKMLREESSGGRFARIEQRLREKEKYARKKLGDALDSEARAAKEPDWKSWGEALRASLYLNPVASGGMYRVRDHAREVDIEIPVDPTMSASERCEALFQFEKRKKRRREEAASRAGVARAELAKIEALRVRLNEGDQAGSDAWDAEKRDRLFSEIESAAGLSVPGGGSSPAKRGPKWSGKRFQSRDGLAILVGRNKDENLELSFKIARAGDVWLHVRGKPGAHVLIPLSSGKSAPLETLLDAAILAIYYSGGAGWGKTEVDYTFKKYIRKIRDSSEAAYTHQKTLLVAPDAERVRRLLATEETD